ncbi:hypothetical protein GWI33_019251 [Rhynchophorus ferrugineus]|uniref:Reverse transcriptase domain-containing protein n=1 Tax=Rhynchophorus ferrugineus TaxID=354439 RepID=A0A834HS42_RHYFE|nr:hypothetical protein GWI33_019251 [Rhynchophorus ferrugineus]
MRSGARIRTMTNLSTVFYDQVLRLETGSGTRMIAYADELAVLVTAGTRTLLENRLGRHVKEEARKYGLSTGDAQNDNGESCGKTWDEDQGDETGRSGNSDPGRCEIHGHMDRL